MITDSDIKKLKEVFATKEDLLLFDTKEDLKNFATKEDLKNFATKDDLKDIPTRQDPKGFATQAYVEAKIDNAVTSLVKEIRVIIEMLGNMNEKMDIFEKEMQSHRIILGDHESRLQKTENKLFPHSL